MKEIKFEHKDRPRDILYELPACVIVELKESTFAEGTKWRTDLDQKNSFQLIQPPFIVIKCCTVISITLRVCKAITIHKGSGMSIGPAKSFESVIFSLPEKGKRTNPVSELVSFSRFTDISALAICDTKNEKKTENLCYPILLNEFIST